MVCKCKKKCFERVLIRCLSQILLTGNVRELTVSKDGNSILIGYEAKVSHQHNTSIDAVVHFLCRRQKYGMLQRPRVPLISPDGCASNFLQV